MVQLDEIFFSVTLISISKKKQIDWKQISRFYCIYFVLVGVPHKTKSDYRFRVLIYLTIQSQGNNRRFSFK